MSKVSSTAMPYKETLMSFTEELVNNMTLREVGRFIDSVDPETLRGLYMALVETVETLQEDNERLLDEVIGYQQEVWELQQEIKGED